MHANDWKIVSNFPTRPVGSPTSGKISDYVGGLMPNRVLFSFSEKILLICEIGKC